MYLYVCSQTTQGKGRGVAIEDLSRLGTRECTEP